MGVSADTARIHLTFPYGVGSLSFELPRANLVEVLNPNQISFPCDEAAELERALDCPIGAARLEDTVRPGQRVALICDDVTRPTPVDRILPAVLRRLTGAGVDLADVFVVVALGTHRPMTPEELKRKVGPEIWQSLPVHNSEFHDPNGMVDLGPAHGVRVLLDRRVAGANVRIGVGSIVPHPATGWSGGAKILYPGVTGKETVAAFHIEHGRVPWNMFGSTVSPVREMIERWACAIGLDFIVNVVCTADGRVYRVVAGHYVNAHRAGVQHARELFGVAARGGVDVAVVGSHPADADFWQATKAVLSAEKLVRDGGMVILVTPCPEGVGPHPHFARYAGMGADEVEALLTQAWAAEDPIALPVAATLARIRKRLRLAAVSDGLSEQDATAAGFEVFGSVEDAMEDAFATYGRSARVSVMPLGAEVVPLVEGV